MPCTSVPFERQVWIQTLALNAIKFSTGIRSDLSCIGKLIFWKNWSCNIQVVDAHWPGHWVWTQRWKKYRDAFGDFFNQLSPVEFSCNRCKFEQSQDWQVFWRSRWHYSTTDSLIRVWYYWTSAWLKGICKRFAMQPEWSGKQILQIGVYVCNCTENIRE